MKNDLHPATLVAIGWLLILIATRPTLYLVSAGALTDGSAAHTLLILGNALVFLFAIPLVILKFFGISREEVGSCRPVHLKKHARFILGGTACFLGILFILGLDQSFAENYRLASPGELLLFGAVTSVLYYTAEEFFFRGFLFHVLFKRLDWHATWITSAIFTLFHLGKPFPEVLFSLFFSVFLCTVTARTSSWIPAAVLHFAVALIFAVYVFILYS